MERRRTAKARRILKDSPVQDIKDVGDFLDVAEDMADETDTYPGFDGLVDLDDVDDDEFDELRHAHEDARKSVTKLAAIVERLGGE